MYVLCMYGTVTDLKKMYDICTGIINIYHKKKNAIIKSIIF